VATSPNVTPLSELALLFLRLGATAFGGPAAHIALMRTEAVEKRGWLTDHQFLDMLGAVNLIPGPNSTELAMHLGRSRHGWLGLVVAGVCFILPAAVLVVIIAWLYVAYGKMPQTAAALYGIKPVVLAVIAQALITLARNAVKSTLLAVCGALSAAAALLDANALLILLVAGCVPLAWRWLASLKTNSSASAAGLPGIALFLAAGPAPASGAAFSLGALFLFFLKAGAVLFGSGYVLVAFLRDDLVHRWHWLTESQLLDAVAVGQVTPGPVSTAATFIGYLVGGLPGAMVATVGIFLPGFFFVAISGPLVPRMRRSRLCAAFLDGVNVASLGLMVAVMAQLARSAVTDFLTLVVAVSSLAILQFAKRVNVIWLIAAGVAIGLLKAFAAGD
jgi:chromate transporter